MLTSVINFEICVKGSIVFLTLFSKLLRYWWNDNFTSNVTPKYFWEKAWLTLLLLKTKDRCGSFFMLQVKIFSWACLLRPGLKVIFYWKTHLLIFFRLSFNSLAEAFTSWTTENKDVSSAKSFTFEDKSSAKLLIKI